MDEKKGRIITIFGRQFNSVILLTHFNIFLYATCFWIQQGVLPYLSKKLSVDPVTFGYLQTVFAGVQLAGGPLFGRFGDLFGSRAAMTLAFTSCALTYLIMGFAYSIPILFLSRLPSVLMHCMQGGQMIVTDIEESGKRADAIGKLGLSYGIGMVVGPLIGGLITKLAGLEAAAFVAFGGSVVSIVLVQMFIPSCTKKQHVKLKADSASNVFDMKKFLEIIRSPGALFLLLVRMGTGLPIGIFQSMFSIVAIETFKLEADQNGYIMSYIGITSMAVQGLGVGILTSRYTEDNILKGSCIILVFSYFLLSFVGSIWQFCLVVLPMCIGLTIKNVVITSALTRTVSEADTGAMIGLNMGVNSLIRTVSPTIGGYMLASYGFPSFGVFGTFACSVVTVVLFLYKR
ncbi:hypothetical protein LOTGIDRAFT_133911 [Lottia gigantea]|uniref:Organic cation transporter-like protein 2 n=1 Tax=Lottia gigantea TaxID=225164 RepID=V3ZQN6_LOTGI|nr:hypothetical protein LOTGIDRAFT_133911 [Lottia gigantea]ESO83196.1 hypothetical protein LOTGIDRAFT_133911 [Lottia gigantea]